MGKRLLTCFTTNETLLYELCVCVRGAKTFQLKIVEISENSGAYWLTHILFMYFPPTRVAGKATRWKISLLAAFCASFGRKPEVSQNGSDSIFFCMAEIASPR